MNDCCRLSVRAFLTATIGLVLEDEPSYNSLVAHQDDRPETEHRREVTAIDGRIPADRLDAIARRITRKAEPPEETGPTDRPEVEIEPS